MKTQTLLYFISAFLVIVTITSYLLANYVQNPNLRKILNHVWKPSWILALFIFIVPINGFHRNYQLSAEQEFWARYKIPQIDSTMIYNYSSNHEDFYYSYSKDSILHFSKRVKFDVTDIYSVSDVFINKSDSLILTMTFIKPNIIRDSSRVYKLEKWGGVKNRATKSIDKTDFDRTIKDWGLNEKIYKRFTGNIL
jgi:hypothetical protein